MPALRQLKQFRRAEDGTFSVETVIVFPLLIWALTAVLVFWDGYKVNNNAISGTYTVADLVSRQIAPVDDDFIDGLDKLYTRIVQNRHANDVRVTVVRMNQGADPSVDPPILQLVWSQGTEGLPRRDNIADVRNRVPLMAVGTSMVMVETRSVWIPPLSWEIDGKWIGRIDFGNVSFTSPRFVPQVKYDDGT